MVGAFGQHRWELGFSNRSLISEAVVEPRKRRDGQAVDLQGLSNQETVNSESVDELLEEGNALEAEAVQGVEDALDADQGEVRKIISISAYLGSLPPR